MPLFKKQILLLNTKLKKFNQKTLTLNNIVVSKTMLKNVISENRIHIFNKFAMYVNKSYRTLT